MESLVLRLVDSGHPREAVVLVEKWSETSEPTVTARIAEARAFLDLRMVDRAWLRLRDLVECAEPSVEAMQVAADLFLLRGWATQARKLVARALERYPGDPLFLALEARAHEGPTALDEDPGDADGLSVAELVRLGEQYMLRGSFLRARTLLERARRRQPDHARAIDLLWALSGDYATAESLPALLGRFEVVAAPEDLDEPEHTESGGPAEEVRSDDASFPQLFRNHLQDMTTSETGPVPLAPVPDSADPGTVEVTAVTALSELGGLDATFGDRTDHGEDTQIARVMRRGQAQDMPIHASPPSLEPGFNLADFRRRMGMMHAEGLELGGEEEDDSVIVHTRDFKGPSPSERSTPLSLTSDAVNERLATERAKGRQRKGDEEEAWARPAPPPPPVATPEERPAEPARPDTPAPAGRTRTTLPPERSEGGLRPPGTPRDRSAGTPRDRSAASRPAESTGPRPAGPRGSEEDTPHPVAPRVQPTVDAWMMAWPYWVAVFAALFALSVLVFAVFAVVAAIS